MSGNSSKSSQQNAGSAAYGTGPDYSGGEKQWIKQNYGNEFQFLASHGMNIHKDAHREEGKAIVQGFMKYDRENAQRK